MNETTALAIRTSTDRVEGLAHLGLVLWMPKNWTKFVLAMSKLTFCSIATGTSLLKRTTKFSLVEVLGLDLIFDRRSLLFVVNAFHLLSNWNNPTLTAWVDLHVLFWSNGATSTEMVDVWVGR